MALSSVPPPQGSSPAHDPADEADGSWSLWLIPVALVGAVLIGGVIQLIIYAAAGVDVSDKHPPAGVVVGGTMALDGSLVACAAIFARLASRPRLAQFGLRRAALRRALLLVVIVAIAYFAFAVIYGAALSHPPKDQLQGLGSSPSGLSIAAFALLVSISAPLAEEFFFRGFVFGALFQRTGFWPAALISALLFGAVHLGGGTPVIYVPLLAALGLGLALLFWRTGSLVPGISLHSLNNSVALGGLVGWTWQIVPLALGSFLVLAVLLIPLTAGSPPLTAPALRRAKNAGAVDNPE
jgi:membrane protease YdiL (CAAX protease family)